MLISQSWTRDASCRLISWHARDAPSAARARTRALVDLCLFVPARLCALTVVCCLFARPGGAPDAEYSAFRRERSNGVCRSIILLVLTFISYDLSAL